MSEEIDDDPYEPEVVPLVTVEALGRWIRHVFTDEEHDYATVTLEGVSSYVREATGQTWLNEDETAVVAVPQSIRTVVLQMAGRIWRNSEGVIQETTGPFTVRWSEKIAEGLYFTDAEEKIVAKHRVNIRSGLFTMPVTMGDPDAAALAEEYDPYDEGWPAE
jgi:hypothetical protein